MSKGYFSDFDSIDSKLVELLDDNQLIRKFNTDGYPITLTISPNVSPEAQMTMFANAEDGVSSRDAKLVFSFHVGEIGIRMVGRLILSDALMNKIKGYAKKMHYLYLQGDYAMRMECLNFRRVQPLDDENSTADPGDFSEFFDGEKPEEE